MKSLLSFYKKSLHLITALLLFFGSAEALATLANNDNYQCLNPSDQCISTCLTKICMKKWLASSKAMPWDDFQKSSFNCRTKDNTEACLQKCANE